MPVGTGEKECRRPGQSREWREREMDRWCGFAVAHDVQSDEQTRRRGPAVTAGSGALIGLLGAALVGFSAWLAWLSGAQRPRQSAFNVPASFLLDSHASAGGVSLGVVMIVLGVLSVIGALLAAGRFPALALGTAVVVVAVLYGYQLRLSVEDLNRASHLHLEVRDMIGVGPFAAAAGGIIVVIGALLPGRRASTTGSGPAPPEVS